MTTFPNKENVKYSWPDNCFFVSRRGRTWEQFGPFFRYILCGDSVSGARLVAILILEIVCMLTHFDLTFLRSCINTSHSTSSHAIFDKLGNCSVVKTMPNLKLLWRHIFLQEKSQTNPKWGAPRWFHGKVLQSQQSQRDHLDWWGARLNSCNTATTPFKRNWVFLDK